MTTAPAADASARALPTRFRECEARGRRLGTGLRLLGRVGDEVDEALMARLGAALLERDEAAAALVDAMRTRAGSTPRVTQAQLRTALHEGIEAVDDAPPALREFWAVVTAVPDWVDWDLVERGAQVFTRLGSNAADVLLQLSLIGGYRFGGPTDLLERTGGLTGRQTRRRLAETQHWALAVSSPGGLRPPTVGHAGAVDPDAVDPDAGRAGGAGWRLTVHVRVMHALVNAKQEPSWDVGRWGLPINDADQAATLGLFDGALILGCRGLGVPIGRADAHALMHLWRWVGHLMGVHPDFLTDDEWERHRINHHILLSAPNITLAGAGLARAIVDAQLDRSWSRWPAPLRPLRGRFEQERMASMLTVFLGARSMRELGLPVRPPWAFGYALPLNALRYRVLDRLPGGRERRLRWGNRTRSRSVDSYFGAERKDVAPLG